MQQLKESNDRLEKHLQHLQKAYEELQQSSNTLQESEARYRNLIESSPIGILVHAQGKVVLTNKEAVKILKANSAEELLGHQVMDFIQDEDREQVGNRVEQIYMGKKPTTLAPERFVCVDGQNIDVAVLSTPVNFNGHPASQAIFQDISEKKQAEQINDVLIHISQAVNANISMEELYHSIHHSLTTVMNTANFYVALKDKQGIYIDFPYFVNELDQPQLPLRLDDPYSLTVTVIKTGRSLLITKKEIEKEFDILPDAQNLYGTTPEIWLGVPLKIKEEVRGVIAVQSYTHPEQYSHKDLTLLEAVSGHIANAIERKLAEDQLRESEERFRVSFQLNPDAIGIIRLQDGVYVDVNDGFTTISGYSREEVVGKSSNETKLLMDPMDSHGIAEILRKNEALNNIEITFRTKTGLLRYAVMSAKIFKLHGEDHVLTICRDITERKREQERRFQLEEQLRHAHKMEAIGTLAGGLAHDFNNLLMGIEGRLSLMMEETDLEHPFITHIVGIQECAKKAANITGQLLGFAQGGKYEVKPMNLGELIQSQTEIFANATGEITIDLNVAPDLWTIEADQNQLRQVILNLYVNAKQAMPTGGNLRVRAENITLDPEAALALQLKEGKYVTFSVIDTGIGIEPKYVQRIFDPFFTTRDMGRGTGLGLASVYGIIKNHDGVITVQSKLGKGSTFTVYLPATEKPLESPKPMVANINNDALTILLVDDEVLIIEVTVEMLENLGYNILTATSGQEAVTIFKEKHDSIDLIILDMVMPIMGGLETLRLLNPIDPRVKVLLSSGYSIEGETNQLLQHGCHGFLQKPFNMKNLNAKIREILGA